MADGSVVVSVDVDNKKAVAELNKVKAKIGEIEKKIEDTQKERDAQNENGVLSAAELDREKAKLQEIKDRIAEIRTMSKDRSLGAVERAGYAAQIPEAQVELAEQRERVRGLQSEYNAVCRSVEKYDKTLEKATADLDAQKTRAGELTAEITASGSASARMARKMDEVNKRMEKFTNRLKGLARRVFVFTLITTALRGLRTWLWNSIKANDQAAAAIAKLKGELLTLAQPLLNVIIPAFIKFVELLTIVVAKVSSLVSGLFGTTAKDSAKAAENLYNEQQAIKGVGSAAKKASQSLAGFDEINTLSSGSGGGSAGSSGSGGIAPDFSGVVSGGLNSVIALFTGLALMAIGAILTFTGANILLGLALMVAGAAMVYTAITTDPGLAAKLVESGLLNVLLLVSAALLVIGAILTFSGASIGLGIALMVAGAAGLAAAVAINWGTIKNYISEHITEILLVLGTSLLAIGAVIAFIGGNLPLGIGLMIAGAVALGAAAGINESAITEALRGPIGVVVALVSGALLALGAVILFTGGNIPLGLGLLIAGALGLARTIDANWDAIVTALQGPLGKIVALAGSFLLVLGIVLLFTGAGIPLGLGLIVAGGASLAAVIAPNWNFMLEKLQECWKKIKAWWKQHIAPIFTAQWWGNLAKKAMNGLIGAIEKAINTILGGFGKFINKITSGLNKIPGVNISPVSWGNVKLPRLAQGAVIPPNKEFLAVLGDQKQGTNIETPLSTMVEAFKQAMTETSGGSGGTIEVKLYLDGKQIARNQIKHINAITQSSGKPVLLV